MFSLSILPMILLVEPCKIFAAQIRKVLVKAKPVPSKLRDSDSLSVRKK